MANNCSPLTLNQKGNIMNIDEFFKSLASSNRAFADAIIREEQGAFEFEDTMERKYEEGFIDGMRHAYILLTGDTLHSPDTIAMEKEIRAEYRS